MVYGISREKPLSIDPEVSPLKSMIPPNLPGRIECPDERVDEIILEVIVQPTQSVGRRIGNRETVRAGDGFEARKTIAHRHDHAGVNDRRRDFRVDGNVGCEQLK